MSKHNYDIGNNISCETIDKINDEIERLCDMCDKEEDTAKLIKLIKCTAKLIDAINR